MTTSIRHRILSVLTSGPKIMDELVDALPDIARKKIHDNMAAAVSDELVARTKDDVTGMPLYSVTEKGKARLREGVGSRGGEAMQKIAASHKAAQVTISGKPASEVATDGLRKENLRLVEKVQNLELEIEMKNARIHQLEESSVPDTDAQLLASANRMLTERLAGVAHALRGSGLPALAEIDDGEDMQPNVAALTGAYQVALAQLEEAIHQRNAWREMADVFDLTAPSEVLYYIENLQREGIKGVTCISQPKIKAPIGYAVMLLDGVDFHDSEHEARVSAEESLRGESAGAEVGVVAVMGIAKNVIAQQWKEAA